MRDLNLEEIKEKIENHFNLDIAAKSRDEDHSNARRIFCYVARKNNYKFKEIGDSIGRAHEVALYHAKRVAQWIEYNDIKIKKDIKDIFDSDEGKLPKTKKLNLIHQHYDDLLMSIPAGMHQDVINMIKLKIESSSWQYEDKTKEFVFAGSDISASVF